MGLIIFNSNKKKRQIQNQNSIVSKIRTKKNLHKLKNEINRYKRLIQTTKI